MAITYFGSTSVPVDGASAIQAGPGPLTLTPPASMVDGDLVVVFGQYRTGNVTFQVSQAGGQTWNGPTENPDTTNLGSCIIWCRFNGTWSANPSFRVVSGSDGLTFVMHVFRPSSGSNTWSIDQALAGLAFTAPSTPFTVSITGFTTIAASTVSVAGWFTPDDNTWGTLAGSGWVVTGSAQYRNTQGQDQSCTFAHNIRTTAGAVVNVSKNQATLGGDAGMKCIIAFAETTAVVDLGGPAPSGTYVASGPDAATLADRLNISEFGAFSVAGFAIEAMAEKPFALGAGSYAINEILGTPLLFGPDPFTVDVDTNINEYPSIGAPKWSTGGVLTINAANDRVQSSITGVTIAARCIAAGILEDQEVRCNGNTSSIGTVMGSPAVRIGAGQDYYYLYYYDDGAGRLDIYRVDSGSHFSLAFVRVTLTPGVAHAMRLKAIGTNPVVLEGQIAGQTIVTYNDSSASRKTSGYGGLMLFQSSGNENLAWVDDLEVDDLLGEPGGFGYDATLVGDRLLGANLNNYAVGGPAVNLVHVAIIPPPPLRLGRITTDVRLRM